MLPQVVWINGPFGIGKSSLAAAVADAWPEALVVDPEQIGTLVRELLPPDLQPDDFQDSPLWRDLTRECIGSMVERFERPLIVPMMLVEPGYFDEIVGGLRRRGVRVEHFNLVASRATVLHRHRGRPDYEPWGESQVDRCLAALGGAEFATHIDTEGRTTAELALDLLDTVGRGNR